MSLFAWFMFIVLVIVLSMPLTNLIVLFAFLKNSRYVNRICMMIFWKIHFLSCAINLLLFVFALYVSDSVIAFVMSLLYLIALAIAAKSYLLYVCSTTETYRIYNNRLYTSSQYAKMLAARTSRANHVTQIV